MDIGTDYVVDELSEGKGVIYRKRNDNWMDDDDDSVEWLNRIIEEQEEEDRLRYECCSPESQKPSAHETGHFVFSPIRQPDFRSQLDSCLRSDQEQDKLRQVSEVDKTIDNGFIENYYTKTSVKRRKLDGDTPVDRKLPVDETSISTNGNKTEKTPMGKKVAMEQSHMAATSKKKPKGNGKQQCANLNLTAILKRMDEVFPTGPPDDEEDDLFADPPRSKAMGRVTVSSPPRKDGTPTAHTSGQHSSAKDAIMGTPTPFRKSLASSRKNVAVTAGEIDRSDARSLGKQDNEPSVTHFPNDSIHQGRSNIGSCENPVDRLASEIQKSNADKDEKIKNIDDKAQKAMDKARKKQKKEKELLEKRAIKEQAKLTKLTLQQQKLENDKERLSIVREQLARRRRKMDADGNVKLNAETGDPIVEAMEKDEKEADALLDMWSRVAEADIPELTQEDVKPMSHIQSSGTIMPDASTAYSTFLVTFSALKCRDVAEKCSETDWIKTSEGMISIDKDKLLAKYVSALRALNQSTPSQYRWDFNQMSFGCFWDQPLSLSEIQGAVDAGHDNLVHAHIVAQYNGSQGRGCRGAHVWDRWMSREQFNLPTCTTVYHDSVSLRPLKDGRTAILNYVTLPSKGYVDLDPSTFGPWLIPSSLKMQQYRSLKTLQKQSAEPWAFRKWVMEKNAEIPETVGVITQELDEKCKAHDELHHSNRLLWRQGFWAALPYYQLRRYCMTRFDDDSKWTLFKDHCIATLAERTRGMEWFEFLLEGLQQRCICYDEEEVAQRHEEDEEFVNLHFGDGSDKGVKDDMAYILNGKTEKEVQEIVKDSCLYDSMKRIMKYKCWSEGELGAVPKLARHLFALFTKTRRWLSNPKSVYPKIDQVVLG